jgi:hypothetical protein
VERDQIRQWLNGTDAIRSACDLDLLRFFMRHSHALLTTEQIANFVGYSQSQIDEALEHLLAGGQVTKLKGRAADADLYIVEPGDGTDGSMTSLLDLASTRDGRLAVIDALPKARLRRAV